MSSFVPEHEIKAFLDAAPDAMVVADDDGIIIFVNLAAEGLFGYGREEMVGQPVEMLLPERFRNRHPGHRRHYLSAPRRRHMGEGSELFARRRNGTEFPAEVSLSPVVTELGRFVCSAIRDSSERLEIESRLIDATRVAERANRAKSALLAAASHDLRQPLQTLNLLHAALSRDGVSQTNVAEILDMQGASLRSMTELLNSLLDISKLDSGVVRPDIGNCPVAPIFERLRGEFAAIAQSKGIDLIIEPSEAVVSTDSSLLAQIIQNLIANAIRYTPAGSVKLRCVPAATCARIEVIDTGVGIPPSAFDAIFEEFYQLPPRDRGQPREGLGLGLAIVRRLAELLGHGLEVESTVGSGSCFTLNLPRCIQPSIVSERTGGPATARKARQGDEQTTILVVDDHSAIATATAVLLRAEGYTVATAASGVQACESLRTAPHSPQLIVCDYHLGRSENGIDVIQAVRKQLSRQIPAVLVTGDTSASISRRVSDVGNCHLLSKPVDVEQLLDLIARSVDSSAVHPSASATMTFVNA